MTTATAATSTFTGFHREAIGFLSELAANNERTWFQPRKAEYERLLKEPLEALCVALDERFAARGVPLRADPAHSPFRIYRDVRFSKDKSPYKTHVSASFPFAEDRVSGVASLGHDERAHGGGGYFHFQPGQMYMGGGIWRPEPARLAAWRAKVVGDPAAVHAALEAPRFVEEFGTLDGERFKRVPAGVPADHADAELLRLKDLTFGRRLSDDEALSPDLPDILVEGFVAAVPFMQVLATLSAA